MDLPQVQFTLRDRQAGVTYEICAYRAITRAEAVMAVRMHNAKRERNPAPGSVVRIITTLGAQD